MLLLAFPSQSVWERRGPGTHPQASVLAFPSAAARSRAAHFCKEQRCITTVHEFNTFKLSNAAARSGSNLWEQQGHVTHFSRLPHFPPPQRTPGQ